MAGLTVAQQQLFEARYCTSPARHRMDGLNFPTPDGACPACTSVEYRSLHFPFKEAPSSPAPYLSTAMHRVALLTPGAELGPLTAKGLT